MFGERLRSAREAKRLTQGQVVARVHRASLAFDGFTRGQLSNYENGLVSAPDPAILLLLARMYGIGVEGLIDTLISARDAAASESPPGTATARGHRRASSG